MITSLLPNSIFLIPIRKPAQHSYSLLSQHLRFCKLQKKDYFVRRYMNYLSHNEFGLNQKSWNNPIKFKDLNNINYWLEQWSLFYKKIFNNYKNHNNCYFVIYEELLNKTYVKNLLNKIDINQNKNMDFNYFSNYNNDRISLDLNDDCLKNANNIYKNFPKLND